MQLFVFAQSALYTSEDGRPALKSAIPFKQDGKDVFAICGDAESHSLENLYKTAAALTQLPAKIPPQYTELSFSDYTLYSFSVTNSTAVIIVRHNQAFLVNPNQLLVDIEQHLNEKGINITQTNLYTNNFRQHIQTKDMTAVTSHFVTPKNPFSFNMQLPSKPIEQPKASNSAALLGQFSHTLSAKSCAKQARESDAPLKQPTMSAAS